MPRVRQVPEVGDRLEGKKRHARRALEGEMHSATPTLSHQLSREDREVDRDRVKARRACAVANVRPGHAPCRARRAQMHLPQPARTHPAEDLLLHGATGQVERGVVLDLHRGQHAESIRAHGCRQLRGAREELQEGATSRTIKTSCGRRGCSWMRRSPTVLRPPKRLDDAGRFAASPAAPTARCFSGFKFCRPVPGRRCSILVLAKSHDSPTPVGALSWAGRESPGW